MKLAINLYYTGQNGDARKFAREMEDAGVAAKIRATPGNLRYDYFFPMNDPETVLLVDVWENQEALDRHHASATMQEIAALREKYDLHMKVEKFTPVELGNDVEFIRE